MILAINYADSKFEAAQKYNTLTAMKIGEVDQVIEYSPDQIDETFKKSNSKWFVEGDSQIGKYGLWRPMIVCDAYSRLKSGDYLVYSDSGTYYLNSIKHLIGFMENKNEDVLVFDLPFIEKHWTKRDVFYRLKADDSIYLDTHQRLSTVFILKKSVVSDELVREYKRVAIEFPELFTDEHNRCGLNNYSGFVQNRHNQSVLSVLTKRMGIKAYRDPTEYGLHPKLYTYYGIPKECYAPVNHDECSYPQIFVQHRSGKINAKVKAIAFIRSNFPSIISGNIIRIIATVKKHHR